MNLRTLSLTVALLAGLCTIVWFVRRPAPPAAADPRAGQPVLDPALAARVARVTLTDQGRTVELARAADGSWTVPSYHDFPADFPKLGRLITDLTEARIRRLVTSRPDRLARLEFKDSRLVLGDASGQELWQATLGKPADGGGRYLRFGTEGKGYLASLSLSLETEPRNWTDTLLLNLKADEVARIEVGFSDPSHAPLLVSRAKKDEAWTPAGPTVAPGGKRLKTSTLSSLLANFAGLRFTDTLAADDEKVVAARAHRRILVLTTFDQKSYTLTLARTPESKKPKPPATASAVPSAADAQADMPKEPEFETIPAGPVFITIACSDPNARVNTLMQKRAFQIGEWPFSSLPANPSELWEEMPAAPTPATPADNPPPAAPARP